MTDERTLIAKVSRPSRLAVTMGGMTRRRMLVAAWALSAAVALIAVVLVSGAARSLPDLGPSLDLDRLGVGSSPTATPTPGASDSATPTATTRAPTPTTTPRPTQKPTQKPAPTRSVRVQPRAPVHVPAPPPPLDDDGDDDDDDDDDDGAEEPDDDD